MFCVSSGTSINSLKDNNFLLYLCNRPCDRLVFCPGGECIHQAASRNRKRRQPRLEQGYLLLISTVCNTVHRAGALLQVFITLFGRLQWCTATSTAATGPSDNDATSAAASGPDQPALRSCDRPLGRCRCAAGAGRRGITVTDPSGTVSLRTPGPHFLND